jgi:GntR family transcriptional regulator
VTRTWLTTTAQEAYVSVESPRPQYRQIADLLRDAIDRGEHPPGSLLPSEPQLAERYGVNRLTVNRAMTILRGEGLVRVERGRGTVVRTIPVIRRSAVARYVRATRERDGGRGAFDAEIRSLGMTPRSDVTVTIGPAPARVAEALRLAEGERVVIRTRRMYANDVPVQLAPSYIPAQIAEGTQLAEPDSGPGGIISRFAELGHAQVRITESVRVRRATDDEQAFLRLEADQPVIEIWHVGWTAENRPVEVAVHSVPAYLWILDYEWLIDTPESES